MRLRRPQTRLVDRLRPYVNTRPSPEPLVSADPVRMFLYRWMIETGDPIEVIARGFDLDAAEVRDLVDGTRPRITESEARRLREAIGEDGSSGRSSAPGRRSGRGSNC